MTYLNRFFVFLASFTTCCTNNGIVSAFKILIVSRFSDKKMKVYLKTLERSFSFRGGKDKGIMSHFYRPGYRIIDNASHPVRFIIDGGANIGDETVKFRHFHSNANIVAVEAEKNNFDLLVENTSGDDGIFCFHRAVWSESAKLGISSGTSNESFSVDSVECLEFFICLTGLIK